MAYKLTARLKSIVYFYIEGFREMTLGRTLWAIILLKLLLMFAVLKLFFFPATLKDKTEQQRSDYVLEQLTSPPPSQPETYILNTDHL